MHPDPRKFGWKLANFQSCHSRSSLKDQVLLQTRDCEWLLLFRDIPYIRKILNPSWVDGGDSLRLSPGFWIDRKIFVRSIDQAMMFLFHATDLEVQLSHQTRWFWYQSTMEISYQCGFEVIGTSFCPKKISEWKLVRVQEGLTWTSKSQYITEHEIVNGYCCLAIFPPREKYQMSSGSTGLVPRGHDQLFWFGSKIAMSVLLIGHDVFWLSEKTVVFGKNRFWPNFLRLTFGASWNLKGCRKPTNWYCQKKWFFGCQEGTTRVCGSWRACGRSRSWGGVWLHSEWRKGKNGSKGREDIIPWKP